MWCLLIQETLLAFGHDILFLAFLRSLPEKWRRHYSNHPFRIYIYVIRECEVVQSSAVSASIFTRMKIICGTYEDTWMDAYHHQDRPGRWDADGPARLLSNSRPAISRDQRATQTRNSFGCIYHSFKFLGKRSMCAIAVLPTCTLYIITSKWMPSLCFATLRSISLTSKSGNGHGTFTTKRNFKRESPFQAIKYVINSKKNKLIDGGSGINLKTATTLKNWLLRWKGMRWNKVYFLGKILSLWMDFWPTSSLHPVSTMGFPDQQPLIKRFFQLNGEKNLVNLLSSQGIIGRNVYIFFDGSLSLKIIATILLLATWGWGREKINIIPLIVDVDESMLGKASGKTSLFLRWVCVFPRKNIGYFEGVQFYENFGEIWQNSWRRTNHQVNYSTLNQGKPCSCQMNTHFGSGTEYCEGTNTE